MSIDVLTADERKKTLKSDSVLWEYLIEGSVTRMDVDPKKA